MRRRKILPFVPFANPRILPWKGGGDVHLRKRKVQSFISCTNICTLPWKRGGDVHIRRRKLLPGEGFVDVRSGKMLPLI